MAAGDLLAQRSIEGNFLEEIADIKTRLQKIETQLSIIATGYLALPSVPANYTTSNVITDRTFNANSTSTDELADALGTLIADLIALGLLQ